MAHKKGQSSSKNGRESHSKRLGIKKFGEEVDVDLGELLTVTVQSLESFTADFLKHEHFLCLGVVVDDGGLYNCSFYGGSANLNCTFIVNEKDFGELHGFSVLCLEAVYEDVLSSFNLELLACNVNDCVHCKNLLKV